MIVNKIVWCSVILPKWQESPHSQLESQSKQLFFWYVLVLFTSVETSQSGISQNVSKKKDNWATSSFMSNNVALEIETLYCSPAPKTVFFCNATLRAHMTQRYNHVHWELQLFSKLQETSVINATNSSFLPMPGRWFPEPRSKFTFFLCVCAVVQAWRTHCQGP